MFFAEKRIKLSDQSSIVSNKKNGASEQEKDSDYISQIDFSGSAADFSLPPVKLRSPRRRSSKQSFDSTDSHQVSSGYASLLSSSLSLSPRTSISRTPKKRKFDDENTFYGSDQFVSPLKLRKNDPNDAKRAKKVLKEKSTSENVILSSTPIRDSSKNKWGRFRSLHPEKFDIGRSLDDHEPIRKPPTLPAAAEASFDCSSFDLTASFNLTSNVEHSDNNNIPSSLQQLWTGSLKRETSPKPQAAATETATKSKEQKISKNLNTSRREFYGGRKHLDICGMLQREKNLALDKIFSHLSDADFLSLSHVSKDYKHMIKSNKSWDTKRRNYLNAHQIDRENKLPGKPATVAATKAVIAVATKSRKRAFAESNVDHSMELRSKPVSPPSSPSSKRFRDIQKIKQSYSGPLRKCPRCSKPATINTITIRSSPRKKRKNRNILKMSARGNGRVQKQNKTFLSKTSIDSYPLSDQLYVTFPVLDDSSGSNSNSSLCVSPASLSSDDSSGNESGRETQTCEFGECSGAGCRFKFCVKCNCKYHPRQVCKDFSPASPSRNKSSVACTRKSTKQLKRLIDSF